MVNTVKSNSLHEHGTAASFACAVLMTSLALSMPAIMVYAGHKREQQEVAIQKKAFMSACREAFKAAYCDTVWRAAENMPERSANSVDFNPNPL